MTANLLDSLTEGFKKKTCRYLLNRYFHDFIDEKIRLDQLTVNLQKGTGEIRSVVLNVKNINMHLESLNIPFELVEGYIGIINFMVPWTTLFCESCKIEIQNLILTVKPKQRKDEMNVSFDSMLNSMSSNTQLAEECFKQDVSINEGVEKLKLILDSIFSKVQIMFSHIVFRIEHLPKNSYRGPGTALELKIKRLDFFDEQLEAGVNKMKQPDDTDSKLNPKPSHISKKFYLFGVSLYCEEFSTYSNSLNTEDDDDTITHQPSPTVIKSETTDTTIDNSESIKILDFLGKHEICIRIKENEEANGPKIDVNCLFGSIHFFLSPKQFHLVSKLINGVLSPETCENSNAIVNQSMTTSDYLQCQKIQERKKMNEQKNDFSGIAGNGFKFKDDNITSSFCESDNNSTYFDADSKNMTSSNYSNKSYSSNANDKFDRNNQHSLPEVLNLRIKINLITAVILHEDPVGVKGDQLDPEITSLQKLYELSKDYYGRIHTITHSGGYVSSLKDLQKECEKHCKLDHLLLIMKPFNFALSTKDDLDLNYLIDFSVGSAELIESLYERPDMKPTFRGVSVSIKERPDTLALISFEENVNVACLKVRMKKNQEIINGKLIPNLKIDVNLAPICLGIDISIIDRIRALLNCSTINLTDSFFDYETNILNLNDCDILNEDKSMSKIDFDLYCKSSKITVFCPIPDFRPSQHPEKLPWWRKSLRSETFEFNMSHLKIKSKIESISKELKIDIIMKEMNVGFENETFLKIADQDESVLHLKFYEKETNNLLKKYKYDEEKLFNEKSKDEFCDFDDTEPSPFSKNISIYANEKLVIPGNEKELKDFEHIAKSNTALGIEFVLQNVEVIFPSQKYLENLYNRFINDLLLWKPTPFDINTDVLIDNNKTEPPNLKTVGSIFPPNRKQDFSEKQGNDSSDDETTVGGNVLNNEEKVKVITYSQNAICVSIKILKYGKLIGICATDETQKDSNKFLIELHDSMFFITSEFNGYDDLAYMFFYANNARLYHDCGNNFDFENIHDPMDLNKFKVILPLDNNVLDAIKNTNSPIDHQIAVAIEIDFETTKNLKAITASIGIKDSILYHKVVKTENWWIMQMLKFFTLKDVEIQGYSAPNVITETHLHLWRCGIDYRPKPMPKVNPISIFLSLDSFSFSSNIIAESFATSMRFVIQDGALFLSECNHDSINLKKNYICVIQVSVFEFVIRLQKKMNLKYPQLDIQISSNNIDIRTCADSFKALADCIQNYAMEYDVQNDVTIDDETTFYVPISKQNKNDYCFNIDDDLRKKINDAIEDTDKMDESETIEIHNCGFINEYDDIKKKLKVDNNEESLKPPILQTSLTPEELDREMSIALHVFEDHFKNETKLQNDKSYKEDEFLEINAKPQIRKDPRNVIKNNEPLLFHDNHFPEEVNNKRDILDAPPDFPTPITRTTVRNLSITWYMYGGRDFNSHYIPQSKCSFPDSKPRASKQNKHTMNWKFLGGMKRRHDILMEFHIKKIRFRSECYPENKLQASRYVLFVDEIEIRDRLISSAFNKFLYLYNTNEFPKPTNGNMIAIKALFDRPAANDLAQECSLKINLLPICLNIDQDSLFFIINFFKDIIPDQPVNVQKVPSTDKTPIMSVGGAPVGGPDQEDVMIMFDEIAEKCNQDNDLQNDYNSSKPIFFKSFQFNGPVIVKIDYQGKRIDMEQGMLAGILVGLGNLNKCAIRLKKIDHKNGLLGMDKVVLFAIKEWFKDIQTNQIPELISSVGPFKAFYYMYAGCRDMVCYPYQQYKKDGRIVEGLKKGSFSFGAGTAMATLELSNRLISYIQSAAEVTYDFVTPGEEICHGRRKRLLRFVQPSGIRDGFSNAYCIVTDGFTITAKKIHKAATNTDNSVPRKLGEIVRQLPGGVVIPFVIIPASLKYMLKGMQCELWKEDEQKYKETEDEIK